MCQHSWKIVRNPFACMIVLQSMWIGSNHCWNFMESGSESATYTIGFSNYHIAHKYKEN